MPGVARVVLLNGVGSAGKSSIARSLQAITREPFLHVPMDSFLDMLPANSFDRPHGLTFESKDVGGHRAVEIHTGPFAARTFRGMRSAVAAMAAEGLDLIVDDVVVAAEIEHYRQLLQPYRLSLVGITASLDVLEERERQRDDRLVGLARMQYTVIHRDVSYDLTVDTGERSPSECAEMIATALEI